mgnify:FL=1
MNLQRYLYTPNIVMKKRLNLLKRKMLRNRMWFSKLTGVERGLVILSLRCEVKLVSITLLRVLITMLSRFSYLLESRFIASIEQCGKILAGQLAKVAVSWGNKAASSWASNISYIRYLGVISKPCW